MVWSTSILTSLSSDTEPSFMITFNSSRYIFNTSENTTRSLLQNGRVWRKTKAIFFTQARVEKMGGLPGLIMTFADATINKLKLTGPTGLTHLLASMRLYTYRDSIAIQSSEVPSTPLGQSNPSPSYSDENITVYPIPLLPSESPSASSQPESRMPTSSGSAEPSTSDISLKRKRELSVEAARKRQNTEAEFATTKTLEDEFKARDFKPENLSGKLADEYRQRLIQNMFPGTHIQSEPEKKGKNAKEKNILLSHSNDVVDEDRRPRTSAAPGFWEQLPKFTSDIPPSSSPPTVSYLVVGPRYRGKFNAEKAKELKVPNGPLRAKLASGEAITFDVVVDGETVQRTVESEEVVGQSETPGALAVFDVPSTAHIRSLISTFKGSDFFSACWSEDVALRTFDDAPFIVRTVYHMCGQGVLEDERYKAFMNGFGPDVHHIVASREHCPDPVTFGSAAYNQLRLNELDENMFPVPKHSYVPKKDISTVPGLPANVYPMTSNFLTLMRPFTPPAPEAAVAAYDKFNPIASGERPLEFSPALERSIKAGKRNVRQVIERGDLKPMEGADVGIVTLGTSGSQPSRYRNVLSTLVKIPGWGNILLDAGEGTWGQLVRNFGLEDGSYNVWDALRDVKCIFISHIHADHHIGLANILAKRRMLDPPPSEPLYLVSVRAVHLYIREVNDAQDLGIDDPSGNGVMPVLSESIHYLGKKEYVQTGMWRIGGDEPWLNFRRSAENGRKMCDALGLQYFTTVDVEHRCRCFGVSFKHNDGWSVTFSGDTAPSKSLCNVGQGSTVLIHEATMGDDESDLARKKSHSTIGQAIAEGKKMNAKNTLLTHFSARYPKFPPNVTKELGMKHSADDCDESGFIVPAFDHMNMTIGDMWKMQFYVPAILRTFRDTLDEDNDESSARSRSPSPMKHDSNEKCRSPSSADFSNQRTSPQRIVLRY